MRRGEPPDLVPAASNARDDSIAARDAGPNTGARCARDPDAAPHRVRHQHTGDGHNGADTHGSANPYLDRAASGHDDEG